MKRCFQEGDQQISDSFPFGWQVTKLTNDFKRRMRKTLEMADTSSAPKDEKKENILEVLDQLIYHLNTTRNIFTLLIVSSIILGPASLIVAAIFVLHPGFFHVLLVRVPEIASVVVIFITFTVLLASLWLYIGLTERSFFSDWNRKFSRFMSLRDQIDKELGD